MNLLAWNRTTLALAASLTSVLALPGGADAFWASHGSGGSHGSRGSYGSYGSGGSYGSAGSHGSYGSYGSAGSRGSYASSGSHGSYASSGSHGSYASSGSHGSPGPFKRLAMKIRANRASNGSSGSHGSYASSGSHGSYASNGSHGSHGGHVTYYHSSAGSTGSHGSHGGSVIHYGSTGSHGGYSSVTVTSSHIASTSTPTTIVASKPVTGSGMLSVTVPADATVYVNDNKTTSTGSQRQYVSHGLKSGQSYTYRVRIEYERDGKAVTESKVASLTAGAVESLAFATSPTPALAIDGAEEEADEDSSETQATEKPVTKLTLRVPADARVTLAGAATKQTGAEREFLTTKLNEGATWEDYTVRVEAEVDGKPVVQERTITLRGGESQAMIFNFETQKLASLN